MTVATPSTVAGLPSKFSPIAVAIAGLFDCVNTKDKISAFDESTGAGVEATVSSAASSLVVSVGPAALIVFRMRAT